MYARIFYRGSIARMFLMFLAFALAGFVTCEWLLAATDELPDSEQQISQLSDRQDARLTHPGNVQEGDTLKHDGQLIQSAMNSVLVIQGLKDTNHREGSYQNPPTKREIGDHYLLVATYSFK